MRDEIEVSRVLPKLPYIGSNVAEFRQLMRRDLFKHLVCNKKQQLVTFACKK